jgi:hypothetical protein
MRNAEIFCQLLPGHSERHMLHQGKQKLVEFSVHLLMAARYRAGIVYGCGLSALRFARSAHVITQA